MSGELLGFVTCPSGKGQELAQKVVEEKLVACVNILPSIRSIYMWKGKVENDSEELLICKTHADKWKSFEKRMKEIHPYEIPEIIGFRIEDGYAPYLDWIKSSVFD